LLLRKIGRPDLIYGNTAKRSIIGSDLNLPFADWNGHVEMSVWTQVFLNRLVWENGDTLLVNSSTRRDVYLEVYLVWHGNTFTYCSNVQGICDHSRALLEVEWEGNRLEHQVVSLVTVYHGTNVTDLQCFLGRLIYFMGK